MRGDRTPPDYSEPYHERDALKAYVHRYQAQEGGR
jgi:hypothetical protein